MAATKAPTATALHTPQHSMIRRALTAAAEASSQHPWFVIAIFGALTLASLAGLPFVRNNTDLVRFLKTDAPLYRDTLFVDANLSGSLTLEFVAARRDGAPLTSLADVEKLAAFEQAIRAHEPVAGVGSIVSVLRLSSGENNIRLVVEVAAATVPPYTISQEDGGLKVVVGTIDASAT